MIDWKKIDTVLLDMDGTLLDLSFDNHFWKEFVPMKFAEQQGISIDDAKQRLQPQFKCMEGKIEWYCLDYWSNVLQLDIAGLKAELSSLIAVLPYAIDFLEKIKQSHRQVLLVTNAHRNSLNLKMEKTCLKPFFDGIICSHDLGMPKEQVGFWGGLQQQWHFEKQRTVLIDDNLAILDSAKLFGIAYLISVSKPDSRQSKVDVSSCYPSIEDFRELMIGL